MANGTYSQSGGYRNDRAREERDYARQSSDDHRPRDAGYARGSGDERRDGGFGGRDEQERSGQSRYGGAEQWGRDESAPDGGYGDNDQSRLWARESYRANPSSFSYEPDRARPNPVHRERYASGVNYGGDHRGGDERGSERYGNADRYGTDRYGSSRYGSGERYRSEENHGPRRGFMERAGDEVASWFGDEQANERRAMDQHRGKGPKGYQRSDARIEEDINDRLSDDPMLDASNISVTVKDAEATLDGFVSSRWDKRRAEDLVEDVSGVRHVQNNLRINNGSGSAVSGSTTV